MYNKKVIIGVAAGVAVLALAGILLAKKKKSKKQKLIDKADGLADNFKSKLHNLQRKAQKEIKHAADRGEEFTNVARDRAADWIGKVSPS
ncbi:hypothetical protein HYN48_12615 [Flavobacterium magnum]|uniref:YtxH domain-containing protein n=1 Tax=Flavobacterium magnum TaxID=2162713 RepID=A0A2S0RJG2_9FLAO|nr:LPXTG cell wall anchor domain-containing protein [Flavobacterium magnum]AWA30852.1 hypothetical protein HYN48_12615 [Flavobacterium magnum]